MMIEIASYNERWPAEFAALGAALRGALGDQALCIDHIGSTSVPGLDAKDIIDIQVTVAALEPFTPIQQALESLGYVHREGITRDHAPPGIATVDAEWQKRFFRHPENQRRTNLHVRVLGRANQRYALLFRDYLRAAPLSAAAYGEVKHQLARYHPDDISAYVSIKDPVCDIIMVAAEAWAAATGWQPGPTDA